MRKYSLPHYLTIDAVTPPQCTCASNTRVCKMRMYTTGRLLAALGVEGLRGAGTRGRTAKRQAFQAVRKAAEAEIEGSRDGWARVHAGATSKDPRIELEEVKAAAGRSVRGSGRDFSLCLIRYFVCCIERRLCESVCRYIYIYMYVCILMHCIMKSSVSAPSFGIL